MDIVFMNGGLGNQAFQYIFARYLEESANKTVLIDDMHFFLMEDEIKNNRENKPANTPDKTVHNGYELEYVFPNMKKPLLISEFFEPDVWAHMVDVAKKSDLPVLSTARQLIDNGMEMGILVECGKSEHLAGFTCPVLKTPGNRYNSAVTKYVENIYFYGYWINPAWFYRYKDVLLKDLAFRPIEDPVNKQYESEILGTFSIGVHIRRGDFIRLKWAVPESYFQESFTLLTKNYPEATFFIFTDDPVWCKENIQELGIPDKKTIFVEGNYDYKNNYIDMQLMTMCDFLVVGNSSFSYLASILNQTPGFLAMQVRHNTLEDLAGGIERLQ